MLKYVKQIRELDLIEKELNYIDAGLLAFSSEEEEKIIHLPSTFLYHDKNIYLFIFSEEILEKVVFGAPARFTTLRTDKHKRNKKDTEHKYEFFSVSVKGSIKKIDDPKTFDEVKKKYLDKYTSNSSDEENTLSMDNLIIIDSEEIQALEEKGG